jgi:hypothetical protein
VAYLEAPLGIRLEVPSNDMEASVRVPSIVTGTRTGHIPTTNLELCDYFILLEGG